MRMERYRGVTAPSFSSVLPFSFVPFHKALMDLFELTRALVDIESVTNNEALAVEFLIRHLSPLTAKYRGRVACMQFEPRPFNAFRSCATPTAMRPPLTGP